MSTGRNLGYNIYDILPDVQDDGMSSDPFDADNGSYEPVGADGSSTPGLTGLINTGVATRGSDEVLLRPDISSLDVSHDIIFTSVSQTTVTWDAGTITFADGTYYEILEGTTGVMATRTIIYLDVNTSTTELQITTSPASAVGIGKVIIATAENVSSGTANFQVATGIGGLGIGADQMNVDSLSSIIADLGAITAGTITLDTSGHIKGGQTDYDTGIGFFLGRSGGAHKWSIGDSSGDKMTWSGARLYLRGDFEIASILNFPSYTVTNLPVVAVSNGPHAPTDVV